MPTIINLVTVAGEATGTLAKVVTADQVAGVFDEIVSLLPVVVPASVGFIAIRKGLSFLFGSLRKA